MTSKSVFLLTALMVVVPCCIIAQEDFQQVINLRRGRTINLADSLTRRTLEGLNAYDLRILRNAYFAKYWYSFDSDELLYSFIPYPWYLPAYKDVSDYLTRLDKENIQMVMEAESRLRQATEKNKGNPLASEIIGVWHELPIMPSGFADAYQFFEDGVFIKNFNQMDCAKRLLAYIGSWEIDENDSLHLITNSERVVEGGEHVPSAGSCGTDEELVGGEIVERPVSPSTRVYPLFFSNDTLFNDKDFIRVKMIMEKPYYKFSDDPKAYY